MGTIEIIAGVLGLAAVCVTVFAAVRKSSRDEPAGNCVTREFCGERHRALEKQMDDIQACIEDIKNEVKDLNKRVQNGDIANRLAAQVCKIIKEQFRK